MTAGRSFRMNSEVHRVILSSHIQPNAMKLIGWRLTVQLDNGPKHIAKANLEFLKTKKVNPLQLPSWSPDLNPQSGFSVTGDKSECRETHRQVITEDGWSKCIVTSPGKKKRIW